MSVKELTLEAKVANLQQVLDFVDENLTSMRCPMKILMQIDVAVEEIFVNVASYAYTPNTGSVTIRMDLQEKPRAVVITFIDSGIPYNPWPRKTRTFPSPRRKGPSAAWASSWSRKRWIRWNMSIRTRRTC